MVKIVHLGDMMEKIDKMNMLKLIDIADMVDRVSMEENLVLWTMICWELLTWLTL